MIVFARFSLTGNWDPKTQDQRYSAKMPVPAIRGMAGYEPDDLHWLPRGQIVPEEELQRLIFPWIEEELEKIYEVSKEDGHDRSTAVATLRLWQYLRVVIVQDAAAMFAEFPARKDHRFFRIPVFHTQEFLVSFVSFCLPCCD